MKRISIITVIFVLMNISFSVDKTGTTAAKFLSIGAGSKAIAMGGAYAALANDASAMYWNPSGIARLKHSEILVNYTNYVADITYNYLAFVQPLGNNGNLGINVTAITMDQMEVTRVGEERTGETFKARQYAIGFTYAFKLTDRFSIGFNGKYINESIANCSASGLALDVGTIFDTPFGFRLGTSISNFGPKMNMTGDNLLVKVDTAPSQDGNNKSVNGILDTDDFDLPLTLRVGISDDIHLSNWVRLTWAVDANHPNDNTEYINAGAELGLLNDMVFIRGGSKSMGMADREEEFTFGGGLYYPLISGGKIFFDYAFEPMTHLGDIHKFTMRIVF